MRHKFPVLTVKKTVKIGVNLRKLSQKQKRGSAFLDHSVYMTRLVDLAVSSLVQYGG